MWFVLECRNLKNVTYLHSQWHRLLSIPLFGYRCVIKYYVFLRKRYPSIQRVFLPLLSARPGSPLIGIVLYWYTSIYLYIFSLLRTPPPTNIFNDSINDRSHGLNICTPLFLCADNNCSSFITFRRFYLNCCKRVSIIIWCTQYNIILIDFRCQMHKLSKYFKSCDLSICVYNIACVEEITYHKKKKINILFVYS